MTEYGYNYKFFDRIKGVVVEQANSAGILTQFSKGIDTLELTDWQKSKLRELNVNTIGELIEIEESRLKEARYVADARARQMKNAAVAAVCEYLLG